MFYFKQHYKIILKTPDRLRPCIFLILWHISEDI